jgi:hypothetical protein
MSRYAIIAPLIILATILPVAGQSPITIGASPSRFDLEIGNRPVNEALRVYNYGTEPARIRVSLHPWTLDDRNEVQLVPPTEQSLDQWMIISPVAFEVQPGLSQTVRFSIRPRVEPAPGEHRAMIFLLQEPRDNPGDDEMVRVIGRLGIAVYGYVGEIARVGQVNDVDVTTQGPETVALFDISSTGTAHVRMRGRYTLWPADLYPGSALEVTENSDPSAELVVPEGALGVGWLPPRPVLPDSRRRLSLRIGQELPEGHYILDVHGDLSGDPLSLGVPFSISDASSEEIVSN